jgi:hypothetical protein
MIVLCQRSGGRKRKMQGASNFRCRFHIFAHAGGRSAAQRKRNFEVITGLYHTPSLNGLSMIGLIDLRPCSE